jgi:hypothetical protein
MKHRSILFLILVPALLQAESLENAAIKRTISTNPHLHTESITNKLDGKTLTPTDAQAFIIHLKDGTTITAADFSATKCNTSNDQSLTFNLTNKNDPKFTAVLTYTLKPTEHFTRKSLTLTSSKDLFITKIDLESLNLKEAYQPYTSSQITAQGPGQWRPGLGQPLYTKESGTYWGLEYPASINTVIDGKLTCSYLVGKAIPANTPYSTHASILGVSDSPDFTKEAFFDYIDKTRIRPLRLQTQYNSWFNDGQGVNATGFNASIEKISNELNTTRGVPPLAAYVIDDGWQDTADWSKSVWNVNKKFDPDFAKSRAAAQAATSNLGLWLSPGSIFGAQSAIPAMKAAGFRTLDPWMSIAHPLYMDKLSTRFEELTKLGITYFKLDGIFGHLNVRNFDIEGFKGSEQELNDPKYDLQKIQYLTDGSDRLIRAFHKMHAINPEVYIVISNGAWLSPWWLQHIDAVWMINADDAAGGSDRTGELVYRDHAYHGLAVTDNTQFPLHSIFNHEPKKITSTETKDTFRKYLYMNMSRGTGFIELYIKPGALQPYDWDVLAEGLLWAHKMFPTFKHAKMHGGSPSKKEVYGYTAWIERQGYVSIHNPSEKPQTYTFTLDRKFGLTKESATNNYPLSSPMDDSLAGLKDSYQYGDTITIELKPKEIRILNFDSTKPDWSKLKALQTRTKDDHAEPEPADLKGHPIIGIWKYGTHTREFKLDGTCTLKQDQDIQWTKPFTLASENTILVQGQYTHNIQKDGTLLIENQYTATKEK